MPAADTTDEVIVEVARHRDAKAGVPSTQATVTGEDLTATVNLFDVEDALKPSWITEVRWLRPARAGKPVSVPRRVARSYTG